MQHLRGENGLALMPPGGWPPEKIAKFAAWVQEGSPKRRGDHYAAFFRAIDGQTEYYDVYGSREGLEDLNPYYERFFGNGLLLNGPWTDYIKLVAQTPILKKQKKALLDQVIQIAGTQSIKEGLLKIDTFLCTLAKIFFPAPTHEGIDTDSLFDAFANFGSDRLPIDEDRVERVRGLNDPKDYRLVNDFARYHRLDTRSLWFFWFAHLHCTQLALGSTQTSDDRIRSHLLAAVFVGQTFDTAYRDGSNRKTRPAYLGEHGKTQILETAPLLSADWDAAVDEMQDLYHIWYGLMAPQ
ncbi:MAG: hypothetical protein K1X70_09580 [Leptospirales bacterium]|nr:hypothetical protein [Leptospirales bacterium]